MNDTSDRDVPNARIWLKGGDERRLLTGRSELHWWSTKQAARLEHLPSRLVFLARCCSDIDNTCCQKRVAAVRTAAIHRQHNNLGDVIRREVEMLLDTVDQTHTPHADPLALSTLYFSGLVMAFAASPQWDA